MTTDINKLCEQELVNNTFMPIKNNLSDIKDEIEEVEFLFKNCCYSKNRLFEELNRSREGFNFSESGTNQLIQSVGLKPKQTLKLELPITMWEDILVFEFHSFLFNLIRTVNFIIKFKLKHWDKEKFEKYPSVGQYLPQKMKYSSQKYYYKFRKEYEEWIKNINDIRNEIVHKHIKKKMIGQMIFSFHMVDEKTIKTEGNILIGISEYNIKDLESYTNQKLENLKCLIENFFEEFSKNYYPKI